MDTTPPCAGPPLAGEPQAAAPSSPAPTEPRKNPGPVVLLFGGFAVVDASATAILEKAHGEGPLSAAMLGICAAEFLLLAVWAVFGRQRPMLRFSATLAGTIALYCTFLIGSLTQAPVVPPHMLLNMARTILAVPLVFLSAQVPVWILAFAVGRRAVTGDTSDCSPLRRSRQFGIQHLLGATTAVALALGLGQVSMSGYEAFETFPMAPLLFPCLCCCILSTFAALPCVWAALVARDAALSSFGIAIYTVCGIVLVAGLAAAFSGQPLPAEVVAVFVLFGCTLMSVLLGSLHLLRACGYIAR